MEPISRRSFLMSSAAVPIAATPAIGKVLASSPAGMRGHDIQRLKCVVKFTGDGQSLTPAEYASVLTSILTEREIEPDYYSLGGVVTELEERLARVLGKERAVFLGTGTLANHLAVRIQANGRSRVIVQADSHIFNDSGDCAQVLSNLNLVTLAQDAGTFTREDVERTVERTNSGRVTTGVGTIVIESPIRRRLGELFDYGEMRRVCEFAREHGIATHLDGARLFMASGYTGITPAEYASHFDTVYVSMWKYFNAPSGAILAGPRELLDNLYHPRRMFGGALPEAWPLAAVALHFIDGFEERFAAGVAASEELLPAIETIGGLRVERVPDGSNVFKLHVDSGNLDSVRSRLAEHDILVPGPAAGFRGFALKVNETLARRPIAETASAFAEAVGA